MIQSSSIIPSAIRQFACPETHTRLMVGAIPLSSTYCVPSVNRDLKVGKESDHRGEMGLCRP